MTHKPKIFFIPCYYGSTPKEFVAKYLDDAKSFFVRIGANYQESEPLNDLETARTIKVPAKSSECDLILLYLISWIDPNVAVDLLSDLKDKPCLLWSADYFYSDGKKTHLGAFAALLPIKGSLEQIGIRPACFHGNADPQDRLTELSDMIDAAAAVTRMRQSRIGMVGYTALGMYPGMVNPLQVKELFGTELVYLDNFTLINLCRGILKDQNLTHAMETFKQNYDFTDQLSDKDQRTCAAMTQAIRELVARYKLSAITLRCCFELACDFGFAPCVPLSILSDECVTSCESDIPVTLTQLLLHSLVGRPAPYVDFMFFDDFHIYAACCGFGAFAYAQDENRRIAYSQAQQNTNEFSFQRVINHMRYQEGIYTVARLNIPHNQKPYLQAIVGENKIDFDPFYEFGCKEYPSIGLTLKQKTNQLFDQLGSQHFALVSGDVSNKLKWWCKLMGFDMKS